ncbi:hypothetical protein J0X14_14170 [Muricauda sp. CAU 1633]|uniref:hypothetical protein n=1 Tax=Allomuricauda sp. CAU 1633 TaxID=2816036 RepID=UPI001A8C4B70|nr:hypothetical protein [Muricauda sp. CAU 1633]MBO0323450.1 hypothetical protein [Muricauda sp. CAU 1633]
MYGTRLRTVVFALCAICFGVAMATLDYAGSWSQYALTALGFLLVITLLPVVFMFWERALQHPRRYDVFYKIGLNIRLEHLNRFTAICFGLVLATPVTYTEMFDNWVGIWITNLHLLFTGLAVAGIYFEVIRYYKGAGKWFFSIMMNLAVFNFICALWIRHMSVGWGETIIMVVAVMHYLNTNKKE